MALSILNPHRSTNIRNCTSDNLSEESIDRTCRLAEEYHEAHPNEQAVIAYNDQTIKDGIVPVRSFLNSKKGSFLLMNCSNRGDKLVGEGSFKKVFHAVNTGSGETKALAEIDLRGCEKPLSHFQKEARLMRSFEGMSRIAQLIEESQTSTHLYLLMDYYPGNLSTDLNKIKGWESCVSFQLLEGLEQIHLRGVVHRDLKPENVFLEYTTGGKPIVRIGDFGGSLLHTDKVARNSYAGSPSWMSPEMAQAVRLDPRVKTYDNDRIQASDYPTDIWSMGLIIYSIFSKNKCPIQHILNVKINTSLKLMEKIASIQQDDIKLPSSFKTSDYFSLVALDMLRKDPHERANASTLVTYAALAS